MRSRSTVKRTFSHTCRALLLAASASVLSIAVAKAQDLGDLNDRILEDTDDVELNLSYARLAEQQGKLRLALAAYERILINNPDNEEAQRGFTRVRRVLEPGYTAYRTEFGVQWDSNPRSYSGWDEEAFSVYWRAGVVDERRAGPRRWRTAVNFDGEIIPEIDELNYAHLGAQTGPIMDVAPHLAAVPTLGVAVAGLGDSFYFGEINIGLTLEGQRDGVSFWARGKAGWRDYGDKSTADSGAQAEVSAGVSIPRVVSPRDSVTVVPWVRWSDVEGSAFDVLNQETAPGQYFEYGLDANYQIQLNNHVTLSAGALAYDREYTHTEIGGEDRRDVYVSPQASITFHNILPCQCAVKATYRTRDNDSNDAFAEYHARQASVSLIARF